MSIVWMIVIGFVIGLVARFIMPGKQAMGLIMTTLLGIGGSIVASYAGQALGLYKLGEPAGFIGAVVGALVLLFVYSRVINK